jgi:hypothetical protein
MPEINWKIFRIILDIHQFKLEVFFTIILGVSKKTDKPRKPEKK